MNSIQEIINILTPITSLLVLTILLIENVIKILNRLGELYKVIRPLFVAIAHLLPIGSVIWYFMYIAAIYSDRLSEKLFFLLIVSYPTLLITLYEIFIGGKVYSKLQDVSNLAANPPDEVYRKQSHNKHQRR